MGAAGRPVHPDRNMNLRLKTDEPRAPSPPSLVTLYASYREACMRLTTTFSNGDARWSIFKELSDLRQRMSRLGTRPARLYDAHSGHPEERCRELLDGILAHFRTPSLSLAADARCAHDSRQFVAGILHRLKSASTWEASVERTRPFQFATMQEDVLLQELDEWIAHSSDHSETYFEVRQWICFLRARDCAVSTYEQVWKPLLGKKIDSAARLRALAAALPNSRPI